MEERTLQALTALPASSWHLATRASREDCQGNQWCHHLSQPPLRSLPSSCSHDHSLIIRMNITIATSSSPPPQSYLRLGHILHLPLELLGDQRASLTLHTDHLRNLEHEHKARIKPFVGEEN
jgi:hypothetical protein